MTLGIILMSFIILKINAANPVKSYTWDINSLTSIGGHSVTKYGNPEVVSTDLGDAVQFDGDGDMLLVDNNPIEDATEFTVEMVFKPEGTYYEPRIIQIGTANLERAMMEIRINDGEWSLDGFLKTDSDSKTLLDETKRHTMNIWQHAAITYKNDTIKSYVNGVMQLKGPVTYSSHVLPTTGQTSLGAKITQVHWFEGKIRTIKVTHAALDPSEFIDLDSNTTNINDIYAVEATQLYPNPASDIITINVINKMNGSNVDVQIFDLSGKIILNESFSAIENRNHININTQSIKSGIYFIKINSGNYMYSDKLIIRH